MKLEAEPCFEALVATDKISRCQYWPVPNTKCCYVSYAMFIYNGTKYPEEMRST